MQKVILCVAPVAVHETNIAFEPLVEDIVACVEAGATFLHLHPRNQDGSFDPTGEYFDKIVNEVLARTDIIVEGSTGSPEVPIAERFQILEHPNIDAFTFHAGAVTVEGKGDINTSEEDMLIEQNMGNQFDLRADFQLFSHTHLNNVYRLQEKGTFAGQPIYNLIYTCEKEHPVSAKRLMNDIALLPNDALFGVIDCNAHNMNLLMASVIMGANFARVGFEDFKELGEGKIAKTNAELVRLAAFLIRQAGAEVATIEEAREMLKITR